MNGLEVLCDSLDEHAALAPDGAGLLEHVRAGAARVRRRRRIAGAGALATVVALALATPAAVARLNPPPVTPAAPYSRQALQLTATLDPAAGLQAQGYSASEDLQRLYLGPGLRVEVHDPGSYDPTLSPGARKIDLGRGLSGFAIPEFASQDPSLSTPVPAVARRDPTGAWIVAYGEAVRDRLAGAAASVRIGQPRDVTTPYRLGFVPTGLHAMSLEVGPASTASTVLNLRDDSRRLMLQVVSQPSVDGSPPLPGAPTSIGGHDTWYLTPANSDWFGDPATPAAGLIVKTGAGCTVFFRAQDSGVVTRAMLERMVREATFPSCVDQPAWTRPLG